MFTDPARNPYWVQLALMIILIISNPTPQAATVGFKDKNIVEPYAPISIALKAPGPQPKLDLHSACDDTWTQDDTNAYEDVSEAMSILNQIQSPHAERIAKEAMPVVAWWLRLQGSKSFISIAIAVHEANHWMKQKWTACFNGANAYHLNGNIFKTQLRQGESRHISIVMNSLSAEYKNKTPFRLKNYIIDSREIQGNQFTVLLDELVAYTGAAQVELALIQKSAAYFDEQKITRFDVNLGGSTEMWVFSLAYLASLKELNEYEYKLLINTQGIRPLLQAIRATQLHINSQLNQLDERYRKIIEPNQKLRKEMNSKRLLEVLDEIMKNS